MSKMTGRSSTRRKKYASISSMSALRDEQAKLALMMKKQELKLLEDVEEVRECLSFPNMANVVMNSLSVRYPLVRNIKIGYRVINSILRGRRTDGGGCGCE